MAFGIPVSSLDLKGKAIKGTAWFVSVRLITKTLSWVVTLILVRLLTPEDYGVFAMATAAIASLELFREFGLGVAIVQRQDVSPRQLNGFFWIIISSSMLLALIGFLGAGIGAWFWGEPRLVGIIRLLSATFLVNAVGVVPYNLLTKEIEFRRRSMVDAEGAIAAGIISVTLAWLGWGVWALAAGQLGGSVVRNATLLATGWRPGLDASFAGLTEILRFSANVTGTSAVKTVSDVVSTAIIGRLLGGYSVGLYSMADSLGRENPLQQLWTSAVNQLSLPIFSKVQHEEESLRAYFLKMTKYIAVISVPANVGVALVASDLVRVLFSPEWVGMIGLVQVLSVGSICTVLSLPSTALLTARGKARIVFRTYCIGAVAMAVGLFVGAPFGLAGVAGAWLFAFPPTRLCLLWLSLRESGVRVTEYLRTIAPSLLATLTMAVVLGVLKDLIPGGEGSVERVVITVLGGVVTYTPVLIAFDRGFSGEVRSVMQMLFVTPRG
jgi:teichuronic acid exporter